jgi:hypothetical protein
MLRRLSGNANRRRIRSRVVSELARMSRPSTNKGFGMHQVKSGIWINLDAVVSAHCVHAPDVTHEFKDGTTSELDPGNHFVLTLTLSDGSTMTFTELKEIAAACKLLGISKPKRWPGQTGVRQSTVTSVQHLPGLCRSFRSPPIKRSRETPRRFTRIARIPIICSRTTGTCRPMDIPGLVDAVTKSKFWRETAIFVM